MSLDAARYRFGVFEADPAGGLWKRGVQVRLPDKPFQVLRTLLEHPGEVVSRKELQQQLWPADTHVEFENGLNNAISRLRETLGDSADSPRFIETLPRRGYRFIASVERVERVPAASDRPATSRRPAASRTAAASPGDPEPPVEALPPAPPTRSRASRYVAPALAGAIIVGGVAFSLFAVLQTPRSIDSVAVLPFVTGDPGGDSSDEYVAFGMAEALIGELSRAETLRVTSQTSVLRYQGTSKSLPQIARELGVGAVVEGSVVSEGDRMVRITMKLIDAATDTPLWSHTYRPDAGTALAIQGELAAAAARDIQARLTGTPAPDEHAVPRPDPEAHEAYLKGRFFLRAGEQDALGRARVYFEEAVAADPAYAAAYAGLADYYALADAPPADAFAKARTYSLKALELDRGLADAHASLGFLQWRADWNWEESERAFRRAIELDPSHSRARRWYARLLGSVGRYEEASEQMARAILLDPLSIAARADAARHWFNLREFGKVVAEAGKIRELDPRDNRGYLFMAAGYLYTGAFQLAASAAGQGHALWPREPELLMLLAVVQDRLGRAADADLTLKKLEELRQGAYVPPAFFAIAYAQLGRVADAIAQLDLAYRERDPRMVLLNVSPWFDPLRNEPRFQDLLRRMDFPEMGTGIISTGNSPAAGAIDRRP